MPSIAIIGAGPAGLFAAEQLTAAGHSVTLFDRMPTPARKFLLAGRGGLNLTHSEPRDHFITRYAPAENWLAPMIDAFPPEALRAWCAELGEPTFIGTSGRVFPRSFKAAPLLRAWLRRLAAAGAVLHPRHDWRGWAESGALVFATPKGMVHARPDATLLAMGGASWPRLGADGSWVALLRARAIPVTTLRPANCGALIAWSETLRSRFAGAPLKRIRLSLGAAQKTGEVVITAQGLEGGALYAIAAPLRESMQAQGSATLHLDLRPDLSDAALSARLDGPSGGTSISNRLRGAGLAPAAIALVQEALHSGHAGTPLSRLVRALPLHVTGMAPLARAISTAGGIPRHALDANLMLHALPGVFAAGEMLDWEAPTGGYLLQACFSSGYAAATGITTYLATRSRAAETPNQTIQR